MGESEMEEYGEEEMEESDEEDAPELVPIERAYEKKQLADEESDSDSYVSSIDPL